MPASFSRIDWARPWLEPYRELGAAAATKLEKGASVAQALNALRGADSPHFVPASAQGAQAYEAFVASTGQVPTRDNLHDFFNGLVWLRFPALKRRLNALHVQQIARHGVASVRGPVRDALTLFDENGALFSAPHALAEALRLRDWPSLFVAQRTQWRQARLVLVGHALLEKLVQPRKAMTAHVWLAPPPWPADPHDELPSLNPTGRAHAPLPVLGVPNWWPANDAPAFYDDMAVFRPAESLRSTGNARPCRS